MSKLMISIYSNWILLQMLLPIVFGVFSVLCFNKHFAWILGLFCASIIFLGSLALLSNFPLYDIKYNFGAWPRDIGIEYSVSQFAQLLICFLNFVLVFFIAHRTFLNSNILHSIAPKRVGIFFAILLFAHAGYIGILSTNDLFNLYVFLEISSLASYSIVAQGKDKKSLIASYDYLLTGTIGATFILIAIGFIFAATGSLNIDQIFLNFNHDFSQQRMFYAGIIFFFLGFLMKLAFLPLHFWVMRVYNLSNILIVIYISSVSAAIGIFWIIKFSKLLFSNVVIDFLYLSVIHYSILFIILLSNIISFFSTKFLRIVVFSSSASLGIIFILIIQNNYHLASHFLVVDILNKMLLSYLMLLFPELNERSLNQVRISYKSSSFQIIVFFMFIFVVGLPISSMFFIKLSILEFLLQKHFIFTFIMFAFSFALSFLYFFKIFQIFMIKDNGVSYSHSINIYDKFPIFCMFIVQILLLIYSNFFEKIRF